jgi:hypothetical protein
MAYHWLARYWTRPTYADHVLSSGTQHLLLYFLHLNLRFGVNNSNTDKSTMVPRLRRLRPFIRNNLPLDLHTLPLGECFSLIRTTSWCYRRWRDWWLSGDRINSFGVPLLAEGRKK